ncbi:NUDIX hydrolase [Jatrophihabitans telluris]|uniref:NUDIX hydrolase n=1 Tax=Jatrophihabitans telluris TaxID=2038343 RepID=A0ABY4QT12_9ACTN|nr:NUDIX hydrolase [Jatrophihabitans telluris]UQX86725.1 NUDIX hydrolase [Jatrophihabitans telluris]
MNTGDGWTVCSLGHRHWGRYGAAGILITDGDRVILQHRAPWTHEGGSWGVPGGARDAHETALQAALREAREEADLEPGDVVAIGAYIADHGGWSYTTVVAVPTRPLDPHAANAESVSVEWVSVDVVARLSLHHGFASAWTALRELPPTVRLLVGPATRHEAVLDGLRAHGISIDRLPLTQRTSVHRIYPQIIEVADLDEAVRRAATADEQSHVLIALDLRDLDLLS